MLSVLVCVCVPGCSRSCTRTTETLCHCSTEAPSWSTGSRPIARSPPGHNTPKTSCRHCRVTTAMLSQVRYIDECRSLIPPPFSINVIQKSIHKFKLHLMQPLHTLNVDNKPHVVYPDIKYIHFFLGRANWEANLHCIVLYFLIDWLSMWSVTLHVVQNAKIKENELIM